MKKNKQNYKYLKVFEKNYSVILELYNNFPELNKLNIDETMKMIDLLNLYRNDSIKYLQEIEEILEKYKDINDERILNEKVFITCLNIQKKTNYLIVLLLNKLNIHKSKINPDPMNHDNPDNPDNYKKIIEDMIMQSRFNTIDLILNDNIHPSISGL